MAKQAENITSEGIKDKLLHMNLPILTLDSRWLKMFPPKKKTPRIKHLEDELNNVVKSQGRINTDITKLKNLKKTLMKEIVKNMEEADSSSEVKRIKKLEKSRQLIEDINSKLELAQGDQDNLPRKIREANVELAIASLEELYGVFRNNQQVIDANAEWIEKTRIELKKKILIKTEKEEVNAGIYSYLHGTMGREFMETYDRYKNEGQI